MGSEYACGGVASVGGGEWDCMAASERGTTVPGRALGEPFGDGDDAVAVAVVMAVTVVAAVGGVAVAVATDGVATDGVGGVAGACRGWLWAPGGAYVRDAKGEGDGGVPAKDNCVVPAVVVVVDASAPLSSPTHAGPRALGGVYGGWLPPIVAVAGRPDIVRDTGDRECAWEWMRVRARGLAWDGWEVCDA